MGCFSLANTKEHSQRDDCIQKKVRKETQKEEGLLLEKLKRSAELEKLSEENKKIEKERDRFKRRYMSITQDRLWKYAWPLRKLWELIGKAGRLLKRAFLGPVNHSLVQKNRALAEENIKLKKELEIANETLREEVKQQGTRIVEWKEFDDVRLRASLKAIKEDGEILEYLDDLIRQRKTHNTHYRTALAYSALLYKDDDMDLKHFVYKKVLEGLYAEEIPELIVRSDEKHEMVDLKSIASFRACLTTSLRVRQLTTFRPEWLLDDKADAYTFVDSLGVARPRATYPYAISTIPVREGTVIKPSLGGGSRGVYLVLKSDEIQDIKRSRFIRDERALKESMEEDLASGWVRRDEWMVEELLYEDAATRRPARDIKFYCFYGKVGLVLEIQRFPEVKYCWWGSDGDRIRTGKYEDARFEGDGVSQDQLALAASISAEIPTPFIRVDFLKTSKGLVFGEFTPKPGNYDQFNQETDQMLGEYYLEAEGRLLTDLLNEKPFVHFKKILRQRSASGH